LKAIDSAKLELQKLFDSQTNEKQMRQIKRKQDKEMRKRMKEMK